MNLVSSIEIVNLTVCLWARVSYMLWIIMIKVLMICKNFATFLALLAKTMSIYQWSVPRKLNAKSKIL